LFLAADGYHHHLGTNTWAGPAATPPQPNDARLLEWIVVLPDISSLAAAEESLTRGNYSAAPEGASGRELVTQDPWGTQLRFILTDRPR
jgi:catechol 2,3-dioxygenase